MQLINKTEKFNKDVINAGLIFLFCISVFFQSNIFLHWTSYADQDFTLTYNALLLNSGFKPEYFDHPGYTQILFLSYVIDLLYFFNILDFRDLSFFSDNDFSSLEINKLFYYLRISNLLIIFFITFFLKKLFDEFINNSHLNTFLAILFLYFCTTTVSLIKIRTEFISFLFFLIFFLYFNKFISNKNFNYKYIFLSGVFFALGIFAKMQIIFLLPVVFFSIYFNSKYFEKPIRLNKTIFNIFSFSYFFILLILVLFFSDGTINKVGVLIFSILLYLFILYISKIKTKSFLATSNIFITFILGFALVNIIFISIKPFHLFYYKVLINFPGWMSMFSISSGNHEIPFNKLSLITGSLLDNFGNYFYKIYLQKKILILFVLIGMLIPIFFLIKKKLKEFFLLLLINSYFLLICLIFSLRISENYFIYSTFILFFNIIFIFKYINGYFDLRYVYIITILMITNNLYSSYFAIKKHHVYYEKPYKITSKYNKHCSMENVIRDDVFMRVWHKKISKKTLLNLCDIK